MKQQGDIIAMHGWSSDSRGWNSWAEFARYRGWSWQSGERGYGFLPVITPQWKNRRIKDSQPRVLIVHSFGLYLLSKSVLASAEIIILLNGVNCFIPSSNQTYRLQKKIQRMIDNIDTYNEKDTLLKFLFQANLPNVTDMTSVTVDRDLVSALGRLRLVEDLQKLMKGTRIPDGFPVHANILLIDAHDDHIIPPAVKENFINNLANYMSNTVSITRWPIENIGHNLYRSNLLQYIFNWLESTL